MQPVKKFFSRNGKTFTYVDGARCYVEWYKDAGGGVLVRQRTYGRLGKIADPVERELAAGRLIDTLLVKACTVKNDCDAPACPLVLALETHRPFMRLKTWQSQKTRLKFFRLWLNGRPPAPLAVAEANAFLAHLVHLGKKTATVDSYRNTLSGLYKKAGLANPWRDTVAPSVQSRSLMYFNESQSRALAAQIARTNTRLWLAVRLLFYCFIRPGEMRLLTVDCFDLEMGTIEVPAAIAKNKRAGRVIIPSPFLHELRALSWLRAAPSLYVFGRNGCPGTESIGKNTFNNWHRAALAATSLRGRFAFYSWKHTGVVRAVRAGINLKDLQLQLRHHSLDMVNEYLKDLGVLDSDDLRRRFPALDADPPQPPTAVLQMPIGHSRKGLCVPAPCLAVRPKPLVPKMRFGLVASPGTL